MNPTGSDPQIDWDEEAVYDAEIAPLMDQIIAISKRAKIPMLASFAYARKQAEDDTSLCTTHLAYDGRSVPPLVQALGHVRGGGGVAAFAITIGGTSSGETP